MSNADRTYMRPEDQRKRVTNVSAQRARAILKTLDGERTHIQYPEINARDKHVHDGSRVHDIFGQ